MNRIELIQKLVDAKGYKRYLEIGVLRGECFLNLTGLKTMIAVDPNFLIGRKKRISLFLENFYGRRTLFIRKESDHFFKNHTSLLKKGIDIALIDGLHTYEQAYTDVMNTLKYLSPGGIIVMHDCFPPHEAASVKAASYEDAIKMEPEGWNGEWCGDVWKAIVRMRSEHSDLDASVINADFGLGIVRAKRPDYNMLNLSESEIDRLSYGDLISNKRELVGLTEVEVIRTKLGI